MGGVLNGPKTKVPLGYKLKRILKIVQTLDIISSAPVYALKLHHLKEFLIVNVTISI